jgi:hypothetical protein
MDADVTRKDARHVHFHVRFVLLLGAWSAALFVMFLWAPPAMPHGILVAALGAEENFPVWWSQDIASVVYLLLTWALLACSRSTIFVTLYCFLIVLLLFNIGLLVINPFSA